MEKIREHVRANCDGSPEEVAKAAKTQVDSVVENNKMDKFMRDKHRQLRDLLADDDWLKRFRFRADVTSSDFHPRFVSFDRFQKEIWGREQGILAKLRSKHDATLVNLLSPIVVFSNIRTFIKGGVNHLQDRIEPEEGLLPLSKEEYLQLIVNDCAVPVHLRDLIYKAYLHYDDHMKQHRLWDDADLDADVYAMVAYVCRRSRLEKSEIHTKMLLNEYYLDSKASDHSSSARSVRAFTYDRIFVDECQDMSPGKSPVMYCLFHLLLTCHVVQIAMLVLLCNDVQNGLFLAGDTAQSVANGVYFRFEEVNSIAWNFDHHHDGDSRRLCNTRVHFEKQKLRCNFRSHDGVLRVCDQIIKFLSRAFPKGTTTVNSWMEYVRCNVQLMYADFHQFAGPDKRTPTRLLPVRNIGACHHSHDE
jgi:hypothetical protein